MREYELLRVQLLKTLLQMEEKLLADIEQNNHAAVKNSEKLSSHKEDCHVKAVFSVIELSDYLGVSTDCIYKMVRENQIPFVRIRKRILFYRDIINSWINSTKT